MFKIFKREQKGFTLVELMVVMGIIAVLAAIVVPAVTGTKGPAEGAQFKGDANAIQSAASKYNNDSVTQGWPEAAVGGTDGVYSTVETPLINKALGDSTGATTNTAYTAIKWDATTKIRLGSGALLSVNFVPDFVPKTPASAGAIDTSTSGAGKHVYIWLLKAGAATDASNRTVEVYKLNDAGTAYTQVN